MILEQVQLAVVPGQEPDFIAAFDRAKESITTRRGFVELSLSRCFEQQNVFVLLVWWDAGTGLAATAADPEWQHLLAEYGDPSSGALLFHRVLDVADRLVAVPV